MLDFSTTTLTIASIPTLLENLLFLLVAIAGIVGAVMAATTREDAFEAANRQSKWIWVAILVASAFACLLSLPFLSWIGAIAIGLYYFDVRPQINSILRGDYY
ncbi:DUF2516 family protein [Corynebacterium sp. S7]